MTTFWQWVPDEDEDECDSACPDCRKCKCICEDE